MTSLPVSVIIITKNAGDTLEACLESVRRNCPAEIIIVDGNSTDHTIEIACDYTDRIYSDGGRGKSFARQLGAKQVKEEFLAYVDADVILENRTLEKMMTDLCGSDCISITAHPVPAFDNGNYWEKAAFQHTELSLRRRTKGYLGTMCCLLRRGTVLKYGFNPFAGGCDDKVLEYRLRQHGGKLGISSAYVYHNHKMSLMNFVKYRFYLGQLSAWYLREYGWWQASLWPPLIMLYWLSYCLIRGKFNLIPYFVVDGMVQSTGNIIGILELLLGKKVK